jgi:LysM repeat protein
VKQKTHVPYWFLPLIVFLLFVLVACVRPVPESEQPQMTETPAFPATVEMPTISPSTLTPLPEGYPVPGEPTPVGVTDPNTGDAVAGEPTAVPALPANHTVQDGETLSGVSQQYGVSVDEVAAANNLTTSSALTAGQVLVIPAPGTTAPPVVVEPAPPTSSGGQTHVVQPGENLFRISLRYGKTVDEVAAYNGIANPHFIYPGQVIQIP